MMIKALKGFILKNDGPWGPINDDKPKKPQNTPQNNENDFDKALQSIKDSFKNFFGEGNNSNNRPRNPRDPRNPNPANKSLFGIVILAVITLWLASGFFKVDSDENAVTLYFGKFYSISTPGLNYHVPYPFGKVIKKSVTKVNTEEFGSKSVASADSSESLMLTGDENIVDIDFQIQWQINDIEDFVFNIADTEAALKTSAQSAMREVIARTPISGALSDGKQKIEQETKVLLQEILDSYGAGIRIVLVQLLRVDPPSQVIDSFRDVQTAKADREKEINQAEAYKNDVIPRARGEAVKLVQEAEAYKESVEADAIGQSSRFLAVYREYSRAKNVTKRRIYLETMERIYEDTDKIIIDKNLSKSGVMPYLQLNETKKPQ